MCDLLFSFQAVGRTEDGRTEEEEEGDRTDGRTRDDDGTGSGTDGRTEDNDDETDTDRGQRRRHGQEKERAAISLCCLGLFSAGSTNHENKVKAGVERDGVQETH